MTMMIVAAVNRRTSQCLSVCGATGIFIAWHGVRTGNKHMMTITSDIY